VWKNKSKILICTLLSASIWTTCALWAYKNGANEKDYTCHNNEIGAILLKESLQNKETKYVFEHILITNLKCCHNNLYGAIFFGIPTAINLAYNGINNTWQSIKPNHA